MWVKSLLAGLLVISLGLSSLSSLTEEEIKILPTLSKTELIQIIMLYENQLNETEENLSERETSLSKREDLLNQREQSLIDNESHLRLRESLLAESFQIQKKIRTNNLIYGGITGAVIGIAGTAVIMNR